MLPLRQQQDVGHEGVITGRDGFSLRFSIAIPEESPSLHSNQLIYMAYVLTNGIPTFVMSIKKKIAIQFQSPYYKVLLHSTFPRSLYVL
ncbi:hypothetical protein [Lysinibacillus xylanilyticus]|uniref:hypothetical protein n=1 Tax=Lysinibacillus xylanilyticus TaxID=582475 RepID=UPI00381E9FC8